MPIIIDKKLPLYGYLTGERVNLADKQSALCRKIKPVEIAILSLTPDNDTEVIQLMRLLSNSPLYISVTVLKIGNFSDKCTLKNYYSDFYDVESRKFDGLIVAGEPDENISFTKYEFRKELAEIFDWAKNSATSALYLCWGAHAALRHFYNIKERPATDKCFGVFEHRRICDGVSEPLMTGISDQIEIPHFRHSAINTKDVFHIKDLKILAYSKKAGASIIKSADNGRIFVFGHMEYDRFSLKNEYEKILKKGQAAKPPVNYFIDGGMKEVKMNWSSTATLFYMNWLNYCVFQASAYDLSAIEAV